MATTAPNSANRKRKASAISDVETGIADKLRRLIPTNPGENALVDKVFFHRDELDLDVLVKVMTQTFHGTPFLVGDDRGTWYPVTVDNISHIQALVRQIKTGVLEEESDEEFMGYSVPMDIDYNVTHLAVRLINFSRR